MGAQTFFTQAAGKTAREAFNAAVNSAQFNYGHAGYTGTIAEKLGFTVIERDPAYKTASQQAWALIEARDRRVDDKHGPAGCIEIAPGEFLFFGWASS